MKVFISWSGSVSHHIARALHDWLPRVIQSIKPFLREDIDKGARWQTEVSSELEASEAGIICLTPDNLTAPSLLFETGALSRRTTVSRVCTFLFKVEPSAVQGPFAMFQHTTASKDEVLKMMQTLNGQSETRLAEGRISDSVEQWWPRLEAELRAAIEPDTSPPERSTRDLVKQTLYTIRDYVRTSPPPDEVRKLREHLNQLTMRLTGPNGWIANYETPLEFNGKAIDRAAVGVLRGWVTELRIGLVLNASEKTIISEFEELVKGKLSPSLSRCLPLEWGIQDENYSLTSDGVELLRVVARAPVQYDGNVGPNWQRRSR